MTPVKIWTEMHEGIAALSKRGFPGIPGATHHIALSQPNAVIAAVNDVVAAARSGSNALATRNSMTSQRY